MAEIVSLADGVAAVVQDGDTVAMEVEEHTHAGMANRSVAGASGLPFAVLRGYVGTDLPLSIGDGILASGSGWG
jgi:acyl CoA:acetate/3-ketoacid CoA transferase alpha subunit